MLHREHNRWIATSTVARTRLVVLESQYTRFAKTAQQFQKDCLEHERDDVELSRSAYEIRPSAGSGECNEISKSHEDSESHVDRIDDTSEQNAADRGQAASKAQTEVIGESAATAKDPMNVGKYTALVLHSADEDDDTQGKVVRGWLKKHKRRLRRKYAVKWSDGLETEYWDFELNRFARKQKHKSSQPCTS